MNAKIQLFLLFVVSLCASCREAEEGVGEIILSGSLDDMSSSSRPSSTQPESLREILQVTLTASQDEELSGVLVRIGGLEGGPARFTEVRDALQRLRDSGRIVHCHMVGGSNYTYWLAAASCQRITMSPASTLELVGFASESFYLRELLDSLGIEADVLQQGTHKGAAEFLTLDTMSPETRETMSLLLDDLTSELVADIAQGRHLDESRVRDLIDQGPFDAARALEAGLVDAVDYHDEAFVALRDALPGEPTLLERYDPRAQIESSAGLTDLLVGNTQQHFSGPRVAILYLSGSIVSTSGSSGFFGEQIVLSKVRRALREIEENEEFRAVVVRIESPGGSAVASDEIWHDLMELGVERPIIASMGDVAASGGYYIAAAAHEVFAQSTTITGSIGVVGGKLVMSDLFENLGVHPAMMRRGRNAGLGSPSSSFTASQRQALELQMEAIYERFIRCIALGRSMDEATLRPLATGQVWTGRRALELGLVDHLGGLHEAIAMARELGDIDADAAVEVFPKPTSLVEQLSEAMAAPGLTASALGTPRNELTEFVDQSVSFALLLEGEPVLTYWPYLLMLE